MPRLARLNSPRRFYHVISRFVDRRWLVRDDEDRATYLRMLGAALARTDWRCVAYALMSNHLHFAMVAGELPMESWTRSVNSSFGTWLNLKHGRLGPVFADRAADFEILSADQGAVIAYIHNNPVRAGVVSHARHSDWTSHHAYLGQCKAPEWLHVEEGLLRTGIQERSEFDAFVNEETYEEVRHDLRALHRAARRRGALQLATQGATVPLLSRPFARVRPEPAAIVHVVQQLSGIPASEFCSRRRLVTLVNARRLVVHAGKKVGLCGSDIASVLGISEQAVSKLARKALDERETARVMVVTDVVLSRHETVEDSSPGFGAARFAQRG